MELQQIVCLFSFFAALSVSVSAGWCLAIWGLTMGKWGVGFLFFIPFIALAILNLWFGCNVLLSMHTG